jgi:hypothetical protein
MWICFHADDHPLAPPADAPGREAGVEAYGRLGEAWQFWELVPFKHHPTIGIPTTERIHLPNSESKAPFLHDWPDFSLAERDVLSKTSPKALKSFNSARSQETIAWLQQKHMMCRFVFIILFHVYKAKHGQVYPAPIVNRWFQWTCGNQISIHSTP